MKQNEKCPKCGSGIKKWMERSIHGRSQCDPCGFIGFNSAWIKEEITFNKSRFVQIQNPITKNWLKINIIEGRIIGHQLEPWQNTPFVKYKE